MKDKKAAGRPPSCLCGECEKCKWRNYMREYLRQPEQRKKNIDRQMTMKTFICDHCGLPFTKRVKKRSLGQRQYLFCRRACKQAARRYRQYGLTGDEFRAMGDRCAICGSQVDLVIDHCHDSETVRGLLCNRCNPGLDISSMTQTFSRRPEIT